MKLARRVIGWFRVVLPPAWSIILGLGFYCAIEGLHQFTLSLGAAEESRRLQLASHSVVIALTVAYAMFRGFAFHPASRDDYWAWLALTPWRYPKPLPLGPVQPVAQDLVVLGALEVLLLTAPLQFRLLLPGLFLYVVTSCWALWLWNTGSHTATYELGYLLGAVLWIDAWSSPLAAVLLLLAHVLGYLRLTRSFADFPWGPYRARRERFRLFRARPRRGQGAASEFTTWGWSYDALNPQRPEQLPLLDRLLLSGLAGWYAFAFLAHPRLMSFEPLAAMPMVFLGGFYCLRQVLRYVWSHAPPISLFGRLLTGRWIIPSYDVALVPVVYYFGAIAVAGFLMQPALAWPARYALPAALTLYLVLMNVACPDLETWRLTCKARLTPWAYAAAKQEYEQL